MQQDSRGTHQKIATWENRLKQEEPPGKLASGEGDFSGYLGSASPGHTDEAHAHLAKEPTQRRTAVSAGEFPPGFYYLR